MRLTQKIINGLLWGGLMLAAISCSKNQTVKDGTDAEKDSTAGEAEDAGQADRKPDGQGQKSSNGNKPLTVNLTDLKPSASSVIMGIYGTKNKFLDEKDKLKTCKFASSGTTATFEIEGLDYGSIAISLFQDMDGTGKINKNMLGVPTEPYGFSNNFRPSIRAPVFKNCAFAYSATAHSIDIKMVH